jgi:hypothetical protein
MADEVKPLTDEMLLVAEVRRLRQQGVTGHRRE